MAAAELECSAFSRLLVISGDAAFPWQSAAVSVAFGGALDKFGMDGEELELSAFVMKIPVYLEDVQWLAGWPWTSSTGWHR
jgi:hypothetical protein